MFKHAKSTEEAFILQELFKRHCERPAAFPLRKRTWRDLQTRQDLVNDRLQKRKYKFSNDKWLELAADYGISIPESKRGEAGTYVNSILAKYKKLADAQNIEFDGTIESWSKIPEKDRNTILELYEAGVVPPPTPQTLNIPTTQQQQLAQAIGDSVVDAIADALRTSAPLSPSSESAPASSPTIVTFVRDGAGAAAGDDAASDGTTHLVSPSPSEYEIVEVLTLSNFQKDEFTENVYTPRKNIAMKNINDMIDMLGENIDQNALDELKQNIKIDENTFTNIKNNLTNSPDIQTNLVNYNTLTNTYLQAELNRLINNNPSAKKIHDMDNTILRNLIRSNILEQILTPRFSARQLLFT